MKALNILLVILIVGIFIYSGYILGSLFDTNKDIHPGETWEFVIDNDNPFEEPISYKFEVLDVKDNYVLYIEDGRDTLSSTVRYFTLGSKCIENCK